MVYCEQKKKEISLIYRPKLVTEINSRYSYWYLIFASTLKVISEHPLLLKKIVINIFIKCSITYLIEKTFSSIMVLKFRFEISSFPSYNIVIGAKNPQTHYKQAGKYIMLVIQLSTKNVFILFLMSYNTNVNISIWLNAFPFPIHGEIEISRSLIYN